MGCLHSLLMSAGYPGDLTEYIVDGFSCGFRLGYGGVLGDSFLSARNPGVSDELCSVMGRKIEKEISAGRVAGPFDEPPFSVMQCSPVRLEPKKVPGEYRFIHNLSHPFGDPASVNYNIPQVEKSVAYSTLDDALGVVVGIGGGAFLAKTDIKSAFKIIPIHPLDYHLLGFRWGGKYYYAKTLPMGAASSCAIFERLSMALQFLAFRGVGVFSCIHVLDDFLFIALSRDRCRRDLQMFVGMCEFPGVPIRVVRALDVWVCPVRLTGEFLRIRGRVPGPLFCAPAGGGYSYSRVCRMLRVLFQACGLDTDRFKGHSFRIGAASEAARLGYSDAQIRLMGRWRSDAFRRYIRLSF